MIPAFHTYANAFKSSILNTKQEWETPSSLDPKNPLQAAKSIEDAVTRYEEFAYHKINNLKNRAFPPMVRYKRIKYQTPTNPEHQAEFATCVETMMFNLFQILLMKAGMFNCSTQRFDTTNFDTQFKTIFSTTSSQSPVIETTDETAPLTKIKKFFNNLYAAEELSDEKMITWCKILANQNNIVYKNKAGTKQEKFYFFKEDSDVINTIKDKDIRLKAVTDTDYIYEIKAFPSNILRAMNNIFNTNFATWEELLASFSIDIASSDTKDSLNHTHTLSITSQQYTETFNLELKSTHGTLSMATNSIVQPENNILELLADSQKTLELDKHLLLVLLINAAGTGQNDYTFKELNGLIRGYANALLNHQTYPLLGQHFIFSQLSPEKIRLSTKISEIILKGNPPFSALIQRFFDRLLLMNTYRATEIITQENDTLLLHEAVVTSYINNQQRIDPESLDALLLKLAFTRQKRSTFEDDSYAFKLYLFVVDKFLELIKNKEVTYDDFFWHYSIGKRISDVISKHRSKYLSPLLNLPKENFIPSNDKKAQTIISHLQKALNLPQTLSNQEIIVSLKQRIAQESFFNSFDQEGNTALHLAGLSNNKDIIALFKQEPAVDQAALNKNNKRFDQIAPQ